MIKRDKSIDKSTFIGGYYIDPVVCDLMVDYFETNKEMAASGNTISQGKLVVNKDAKDSLDIGFGKDEMHQPIRSYRIELQKCLDAYTKDFEYVNGMSHFNIDTMTNIQYYPPGGGFKRWHFERLGKATSNKCLAFLTYLNDLENGGTEFYYQKLKTKAEKGLTIIFPTDWTHTHRGVVSDSHEKYIVAGWYSYIGD